MDELAYCSWCGSLTNPANHECAPSVWSEPVFLWEVVVGGQHGIVCKMQTDPPNRFQRWMYKALLGWQVNVL